MAERFLKFIPSEEALYLARKNPNAFILLLFIAERARRGNGHPDGLVMGQCHIGDYQNYGLTEREYRTAKEILVKRNFIKIIETCRTRQKSTNGTTTLGTLVQLLDSRVWDINSEVTDDRKDDRPTTDRRGTRRKKNEKEDHPSIPSNGSDRTDDFSFGKEKIEIVPQVFLTQSDLDQCLKIKGTMEKVKHAIEQIQNSPKRKHPIADWPNTLMKWKIENKGKAQVRDGITYTEKLCKEFPDYDRGRGWRCYMYNDTKKDQRGILFESESAYQEPFFAALVDGELREKCENFIETKNMRNEKLVEN